jgi:hypothetical protein
MIIDDLDVVGVAIAPNKTDAPLVADADAVLSGSIATKNLQAVARGSDQIPEFDGGVELAQFPQRHALNGRKPSAAEAVVKSFRLWAAKRLNHTHRVQR